MLEMLSREQILELYTALRAEYFELCIDSIELERAAQRAFAMVELAQLERKREQSWSGESWVVSTLDQQLLDRLFCSALEDRPR